MSDFGSLGLDKYMQSVNSNISVNQSSIDENMLDQFTRAYTGVAGVVSTVNFGTGIQTQDGGYNQVITGTTDTPLSGGTLSIVLKRAANILFLVDYNTFWSLGGTMSHAAIVKIKVNGSQLNNGYDQMRLNGNVPNGTMTLAIDQTSHAIHALAKVGPGTNTYTVTGAIGSISGPLGTLTIYSFKQTFLQLGN